MPDDIARCSDLMAREPGGMAWIALADAQRRAGRIQDAERTAVRGLLRHPYAPDGHDVLARIAADAGDMSRARDEWEMTLRLDARHLGAHLGMAWLAHVGGDDASSARWREAARAIAPDDPRVAAASGAGRDERAPAAAASPAPSTAAPNPAPNPAQNAAPNAAPNARPTAPNRRDVGVTSPPVSAVVARAADLFRSITQGGARIALLVDDAGLVLAGRAPAPDGTDCSDEVGAELSGLSGDAERARLQLQLGRWEQLLVECEDGALALAPAPSESVMLVATPAGMPPGLPRLLLDRGVARATGWLEAL